jgi:fucose 4-O-acetylase-like acetyltransferase
VVYALFFLLSGVGSWYALRSRSDGQYLLERVKRLLVPLYTVGLFVISPPAFYFESFSNAGYSGTFWEILPRYFSEWSVAPLPRAALSVSAIPYIFSQSQ